MNTGIEQIAEERQEQIEKHGRTTAYDVVANKNGQLEQAAKYLLSGKTGYSPNSEWPRDWSEDFKRYVERKPHIERLKIAGALIAAEIDRLQNL